MPATRSPRLSPWSTAASMRMSTRREKGSMGEIRLRGRPAAPGFARGPLVTLEARERRRLPNGDPLEEASALRAALAAAAAQLVGLRTHINGTGADILGFQLALLED